MSRCVFCTCDASTSRSVEHIIPESLGNTKYVLPPGIVCDKCNNYFATKVEKPFLETEALRHLRFHQGISSKRGRIPLLDALLIPGFPVTLQRISKPSPLPMAMDVPPEGIRYLMGLKGRAHVIFPVGVKEPEPRILSRFLAKAAIEAIALRLVNHPNYLDSFATEPQLVPIRNHARRGDVADWPVHCRRIYDADAAVFGHDGKLEQVVHESDILVTPWNEWFFVLCLFGLELAINYGGPETDGYRRWLSENEGRSPLYTGRNNGPLPCIPTSPADDDSE